MALLEMKNVSKSYHAKAKVLKNINLQIEKGKLISVIGPSGAGKSTLLRTINRMVQIDGGKIIFDGVDTTYYRKQSLRKMRRDIGMVFQHYNLVPRLTVIENVLHGRLGYKTTLQGLLNRFTEEEKQRAFSLLDTLGIVEHAYKRCDQLSGGQQQRVGIARALIQSPQLILCDEPIASLDPNASEVIMNYLKRITEEYDITCIVNLHQVDVAKQYSDRIIGLNEGAVVFDGVPLQLTEDQINHIYGIKTRELITV